MALTPQRTLRERILLTLVAQPAGRATRAEALDAMDSSFSTQWTADDLQSPNERPWESKWRNRASYERANMVRDGLLGSQAPGVWMLTEAGRAAAEALSSDMARLRAQRAGGRRQQAGTRAIVRTSRLRRSEAAASTPRVPGADSG